MSFKSSSVSSYYYDQDEIEDQKLENDYVSSAIKNANNLKVSREFSRAIFKINANDDYMIPDYRCDMIEDNEVQKVVKITIDEDYTKDWNNIELTSIRSSYIRKRETDEKLTFLHDYTFWPLEKEMDVKIGDAFGYSGKHSDKMTPDSIKKRDGFFLVTEFTTSRLGSESSAKMDLNAKSSKYHHLLREKDRNKDILFNIIVVTPHFVMTNYRMPDEIANELCLRYRLAISIEAELLQIPNFIRVKQDDDQNDNFRKLNNILSSIKEESLLPEGEYGFPELKRENRLNKWFNDINLQDMNETIIDSMKVARLEILDTKFCREDTKILSRRYFCEGCDFKEWEGEQVICEEYVKEYDETCELIKDKEIESSNVENSRNDYKAISKYPLIHYDSDYEPDTIIASLSYLSGDSDNNGSEGTFYDDIMKGYISYLIENPEKSIHEEVEDALKNGGMEDSISKRKYHRIFVDIPSNIKLKFALEGVNAKEMSDDFMLKEELKEKNRIFNLMSPIDDISKFIDEDWELLRKETLPMSSMEYGEDFMELLRSSMRSFTNDEKKQESLLSAWDKFRRTRLGEHCQFISECATELTYSLKQNCKRNEWVVKHLSNGVIMLIKPTNFNNHIFYKFIIDNELINNGSTVFPKTESFGRYKVTQFLSSNVSKLQNQVKCSVIMFSSFIHFCAESEMTPMGEDLIKIMESSGRKERSIWKSLSVIYLNLINDNQETEDLMMQVRYICMEGFISLPLVSNPKKMIEKVKPYFFKRLSVWVAKKLFCFIKQLSMGFIYIASESTDPFDTKFMKRKNLFNHFIGENYQDLNGLIQSYYWGYVRNKEEKSFDNKYFRILSKIAEYELKFDYKSIGSIGVDQKCHKEEMSFFDYDINLVNYCTDMSKEYLKKRLGWNWSELLEEKIDRALIHQDIFDTLSSLKASSGFTYKTEDLKFVYDEKSISSLKVVEAAKEFLFSDEKCVFELIPKCMELIENGARIKIFIKNQHGGDREIFVLEICARVLQAVIELICRTICKEFPEEITSNPKNESKIFAKHYQMIDNNKGKYRTFGASCDMSKWSQSHYLAKFSQFLCRLLPFKYHNLIIGTIKIFMNREILLPKEVLKIFNKFDKLKVHDEVINVLHKSFKGEERNEMLRPGGVSVRTRTGMMQGIFHITSSLFHVCMMQGIKSIAGKVISDEFKNDGLKKEDMLLTTLITSDDSAYIMSIKKENKKISKLSPMICRVYFLLCKELWSRVGMKLSIKSTLCTEGSVEFKSSFLFEDNIYQAFIKQVFASLIISNQNSLYARQEEMYNTNSSLLQEGASLLQVFFNKVSQAELFYRMIGMGTLGIFKKFMVDLLVSQNPYSGYFMLESPVMTGIPGFEYSLWVLCIDTNLGILFKQLFEKKINQKNEEFEKKFVEDINNPKKIKYMDLTGENVNLEFLNNTLARSMISFDIGKSKKAKKLIEKMDVGIEDLEYLEENPELIIRSPLSSVETKSKIAYKLLSPSVQSSINNDNPIISYIASAVYMMKSKSVVFKGSAFSDMMGGSVVEGGLTKKSLFFINRQLCNKIKSPNSIRESVLNTEEMRQLFPLFEEYENLRSLSDEFLAGQMVQNLKVQKRKKFDITVFEDIHEGEMTFRSFAYSIWFDRGRIIRGETRRYLLNYYQAIFPWFRETWTESLDISFFSNSIEMMNFIEMVSARRRILRMKSANTRYTNNKEDLRRLLKNSVFPSKKLTVSLSHDSVTKASDHQILSGMTSTLSCLTQIPLEKEYLCDLVDKIITGTTINERGDQIMSGRYSRLRIMTKFRKGEYKDMIELYNDIRKQQFGIIGSWTVAQNVRSQRTVNGNKFIYEGNGVWEGFVEKWKVILLVSSKEINGVTSTYLQTIMTSCDLLNLAYLMGYLKQFFVEKKILTTDRLPRSISKSGWSIGGVSILQPNSSPMINYFDGMLSKHGCEVFEIAGSYYIQDFGNLDDVQLTFSKSSHNVLKLRLMKSDNITKIDSLIKLYYTDNKKELKYGSYANFLTSREYSNLRIDLLEYTDRKHCIFSFDCKPSDIKPVSNKELDKLLSKIRAPRIVETWLRDLKLDSKGIDELQEILENQRSWGRYIIIDELHSIVKSNCIKQLKKQNINFQNDKNYMLEYKNNSEEEPKQLITGTDLNMDFIKSGLAGAMEFLQNEERGILSLVDENDKSGLFEMNDNDGIDEDFIGILGGQFKGDIYKALKERNIFLIEDKSWLNNFLSKFYSTIENRRELKELIEDRRAKESYLKSGDVSRLLTFLDISRTDIEIIPEAFSFDSDDFLSSLSFETNNGSSNRISYEEP